MCARPKAVAHTGYGISRWGNSRKMGKLIIKDRAGKVKRNISTVSSFPLDLLREISYSFLCLLRIIQKIRSGKDGRCRAESRRGSTHAGIKGNIMKISVLSMIAILLLGGCACETIKKPNLLHPGHIDTQIAEMEKFNPFPENGASPKVDGAQPRGFDPPNILERCEHNHTDSMIYRTVP